MRNLILSALLCISCLTIADGSPGEKCGVAETICRGGPETRIIDDMAVYRECWEFTTHYACVQPEIHDTCVDQVSRGGTMTGTGCTQGLTIDGSFQCITDQREYTFKNQDAKSSTVTDCSGQQFCIDGKCFDTGSTPDPDFNRAVAGMEAAREAGVYIDDGDFQIFKGQDNRCSKSVLQNCCKGTSKKTNGLTNLALTGGSAYAFDVLGVGSGKSSLFVFGFDPALVTTAIAVEVIQEMSACSKDEALIAVKRDHRLCHYIGDYCSKSIKIAFINVCIQHKETYCCYNSKLSRMINEAARLQLPSMGGWGGPTNPSCKGLTITQFQSMDLAAVDFTEFYADIQAKGPDQTAIQNRAQTAVQSYFK